MKRDITERLDSVMIGSGVIRGLADWLRNLLTKIVQETPLRPLKLFLNGTWLEHPLHPVLTDIPIGAWTVAIILDLAALIFRVPSLGLASGLAIGIGVLAALGSIVTGLLDMMDVDPPEGAVAFVHGITNILATILFAISYFVRQSGNWDIEFKNVIWSFLGYLLVLIGGYLGGTLVFRQGVMVNRNAYRSEPKDFVPVMALKDLKDNTPTRVQANGEPVLLVRRGEKVSALGAVCSHYGAPLEEGKLKDGTIVCPWHYSRYSLEDGSVKEGPTAAPVPYYETRVVNGRIQVKIKKEVQ